MSCQGTQVGEPRGRGMSGLSDVRHGYQLLPLVFSFAGHPAGFCEPCGLMLATADECGPLLFFVNLRTYDRALVPLRWELRDFGCDGNVRPDCRCHQQWRLELMVLAPL